MANRKIHSIICNDNYYRSQKHPVLEYIFRKYNPKNDTSIKVIVFTLADISEAYSNLEIYRINRLGQKRRIKEPASISNTILDLVRQDRSIKSRMPDSLIELGYDLRKKTGDNVAGEFVFVGFGNYLSSWITWGDNLEIITIDSTLLPPLILDYLRRDEGALFSVIDYCDILSQALYKRPKVVIRVQHPLKWQPNEIDGFYVCFIEGVKTLFPVEAKALTTHDEINLDQILGGINTISATLPDSHAHIIPLAVKMVHNGIQIAVFSKCEAGAVVNTLEIERTIAITFDPPIRAWQ